MAWRVVYDLKTTAIFSFALSKWFHLHHVTGELTLFELTARVSVWCVRMMESISMEAITHL